MGAPRAFSSDAPGLMAGAAGSFGSSLQSPPRVPSTWTTWSSSAWIHRCSPEPMASPMRVRLLFTWISLVTMALRESVVSTPLW